MNHSNNSNDSKRDTEPKSNSISFDRTARHKNQEKPPWFTKGRNAIYYILGAIEILLVFRFIFKLLGANSQNAFVASLYSIAGFFIKPFSGIFNSFAPYGLASNSVFEPAAIIGMVVYAVLAWGLAGLISIDS